MKRSRPLAVFIHSNPCSARFVTLYCHGRRAFAESLQAVDPARERPAAADPQPLGAKEL